MSIKKIELCDTTVLAKMLAMKDHYNKNTYTYISNYHKSLNLNDNNHEVEYDFSGEN